MNERSWHPHASLKTLKQRATAYAAIRHFFAQRNVLEVETPILASAATSDPQIESLHTDQTPPLWLRTSPEYFHKRLLAAGVGDLYELGKVFRAGEAGRWHNPEFTMLEWYRVDWQYHQLMDEVEALVRMLLAQQASQWTTRRISYRALHREILCIDPFTLAVSDWVALAQQHGLTRAEHENVATLQDFIYSIAIRRHLPARQLTFIYDYPIHQAALARIRNDTPPVAERFELFMGTVEIANGYQELTDADEQAQRFENDTAIRQQQGQTVVPTDQHLLQAMRHGLPQCSGVALGVDRLLALLGENSAIAATLAFDCSNC